MAPESRAELRQQAPSTVCGATTKASAPLEVGPPTPSPGGPSILPPVKGPFEIHKSPRHKLCLNHQRPFQMQELEIALPQKISFWPIQAASWTLTPGSNESNPVYPQMSPAMKSPSETSRATAAPPTTGFGGQPREQCGFLQPSVFSENPRDTRGTLGSPGSVPTIQRLSQNKPFSF